MSPPRRKYGAVVIPADLMTLVRTHVYRRSLDNCCRTTIRSVVEEAVRAYLAAHESDQTA